MGGHKIDAAQDGAVKRAVIGLRTGVELAIACCR